MQHKRPFHLVISFLLASVMLFGALAPALAAAPAQADEGEMQVWASNLYPAADAPGMMEIVALYPNNAAEVVSIYLTKGVIVENGSWEAGEEEGAVVVTLTGNNEIEYDQPATLSLAPVDDMLTDGIFSYHALTVVTPEEMDAMVEAAEAGEASPEADAAAAVAADDFGSIWVSNVYPAADAAGLITVMALYANGAMEQTSIYLTKDAISEVGVWEEDEDGAIAVSVTGTPEEEYAEPTTTTYTLQGDALINGAFALALWPQVAPEEMMVAADPSGTYVSNVYPAADAAGYVTLLSLFANNNAEQTTVYLTKGAVTEVGVWEKLDDGSIVVTLTGTPEEAYDEEVATTYDWSGEMLQDGAFLLFKLLEITPSMMDAATAPSVIALFESATLPAASSPGRIITLTLYDDETLTMSTDFLNDEAPIVEMGVWQEGDDGSITVTLTGKEDMEYDEPTVIVFAFDDENQLVAVEYDETLFGSEGLTLLEQPLE
jgi:uncharacterized lipoprotein NlpE involved in copper resistance